MWLRALKLEGLTPAGVLHFSMYDQMIQAALAGQGVALGRSPLIDGLLREKQAGRAVQPDAGVAAQLLPDPVAAAARKPEVQAFVAWLHREARLPRPRRGAVQRERRGRLRRRGRRR